MNRLSTLKSIKFVVLIYFIFYSHFLLAQEKVVLQIRTIAVSPYGINNDDKSCGIYYDLINNTAKKLNYEIEHVIQPYARILNELKFGGIDLAILFKYEELQGFVTFLEPLLPINNVVLALSGVKLDSFIDLEGKRLGYLRGARFSIDIDNNTKIVKYETKDFLQSLKMLKAGRLDAVIGPQEAILSAASKLGMNDDSFSKPLIVSTRTPWLQLSNKSTNQQSVQQFKEHFKQLLNEGDLQSLYSKYQENDYKCY